MKRFRDTKVGDYFRERSKANGHALDFRQSLTVLFGLSYVAYLFGVSFLVSGFAAGAIVALIGEPRRFTKQLIGAAEGFFVPLFFVLLGAQLDFRQLLHSPINLDWRARRLRHDARARRRGQTAVRALARSLRAVGGGTTRLAGCCDIARSGQRHAAAGAGSSDHRRFHALAIDLHGGTALLQRFSVAPATVSTDASAKELPPATTCNCHPATTHSTAGDGNAVPAKQGAVSSLYFSKPGINP